MNVLSAIQVFLKTVPLWGTPTWPPDYNILAPNLFCVKRPQLSCIKNWTVTSVYLQNHQEFLSMKNDYLGQVIIESVIKSVKGRITREGELIPFEQIDLDIDLGNDSDKIFLVTPQIIVHPITEDSVSKKFVPLVFEIQYFTEC